MTEHLPECPLLEPCSADHPEHGFCSRHNTICIHCERQCVCIWIHACEERMNDKWEKFSRDQFDAGHSDGYKKAVADAQYLLEEQGDSTGWVALTKMTQSDG